MFNTLLVKVSSSAFFAFSLIALSFPKGLSREVNHNDLVNLLSTNTCRSCDLSYSDLAYSSLYAADLSGTNLSDATLINSILTNANLRDSNLTNVNFSGSDLKGVNFTGAILKDTNFNQANLSGAIISREQLLQSRWQHASSFDISLLLDSDILELVVINLRANQLVAAKHYLSSMSSRSNENASFFVLRASINFKSGDISSAVNDLQNAKNIFKSHGDIESSNAVDGILIAYQIKLDQAPSKAYGSGHGIEMLNAIKNIVPIILPLTSKFLLPLSLL